MLPIKRQRPPMHFKRRIAREIPRAIALGTIPVIFNSQSSEQFSKIFDLLLAGPFFLNYYFWLLLAFMLVGVWQFKWRFQSNRHQAWLNSVHRFLGDIGGSFLTATRTGLGAIIGFLITWRVMEPHTATVQNVLETAFYVVLLLVVCAAFSLLEETLRNPREAARRDRIDQ